MATIELLRAAKSSFAEDGLLGLPRKSPRTTKPGRGPPPTEATAWQMTKGRGEFVWQPQGGSAAREKEAAVSLPSAAARKTPGGVSPRG